MATIPFKLYRHFLLRLDRAQNARVHCHQVK
jgi:hypothetical protein